MLWDKPVVKKKGGRRCDAAQVEFFKMLSEPRRRHPAFEKRSVDGPVKERYIEFCVAISAPSAPAFRSFPQYGQNLSDSTTSCLHCGQEAYRFTLQLGQKLKRAPTVLPQAGQRYCLG